ncbi:LysE family translocator [Xenorhabdus kozodoii]|uniref:Lysine transporter LysE n=1 Tax=Xenorhabdus kozodoii TaxID=351676 RepID=A0A2D0LBN2_9GAMM|nr:LysE family translocator [Xenorhabdus kozodoii]PHM73104.1 lysine transporter LysE [Xenorhabdus kozodoii]
MSLGIPSRAATAFGTTLGAAIYAVATLLGLSSILAALPWMLTIIQIVGGGYLVYLGIMLIRLHIKNQHNTVTVDVNTETENRKSQTFEFHQSTRKAFLKGFYVSIGNPKMAAFFFGLFAPVSGNPNNLGIQFTILIGVIIIDLIYHQALARLISLASRSFARTPIRKWLDAVVGGLMVIFGIGLLLNIVNR